MSVTSTLFNYDRDEKKMTQEKKNTQNAHTDADLDRDRDRYCHLIALISLNTHACLANFN